MVVSVNHRLGLLGYNALPAIQTGTEEENSGNLDCWIWPPLWTGWRRTLRVSAETAGTSPSPAPLREAAM